MHRNIMKNDMVVQWKIKQFETSWLHDALAVCLSIKVNTTHLLSSAHTTLKIELSSAES